MSASETTRRRKDRMLLASKTIQETYNNKGWTNRIIYEGAANTGIMTYPTYDSMRDGTTVTTPEEQQQYRDQVPNREPDPPSGVVISGADGDASVNFSAPEYQGVCPVLYYSVNIQPGDLTVTGTQSPIAVTGLSPGTTYTFTITAVNCVGPSLPVTADPFNAIGGSDRPTAVSAVAGNAQATVSFTPPAATGGAPVTSYTVISNPGNITESGSSSPITVTGLTNGTAYTFTVVAVNAIGNSPASTASAAVTPKTVPDPPTNVTAVRGNTQVSVQFTPPVVDGGAAITSYTVTSSPGGFTATGASSPLTVTGLTNGTAYTFTATATNSVGTSSPSDPSTSATPATTPGAPTAVSAVAGSNQAVVSFTAPVSNGGSAITSYRVTSSPGGFTATGGSSPITVLGLSNGTSYTFTVVAINGVGTSSASSASNSVTPAGSPVPSAPTNVSAVPGNTQATITFTASASGSPTSYTVTSSPGGFTATGSGSPLTVTGLTNGTTYTFSVVATNGSGNSNPGVSNQITAGTPLAPVLTSLFPTVNDVTVSFTQPGNSTPTVTNYKYSVNGGPFVSFSPADNLSPATIAGLTATTAYSIVLRATNANGDSLSSNTLSTTTYTTMHTQSFTTVGASTWTAPAGVTFVQYVIVGGGGGGGACYSDILVLGDLPFVATAPSPTSYWIKNNGVGNTFYGYFYRGNSYANITKPFRASVLAALNNSPPEIRPNGTYYLYQRWYADTIVYSSGSSVPLVSNYFSPYTINSARCNNVSGGGGGGAGGQVRYLSGISTYTVTPGATYNIVVGDGGAGGTATATTEAAGSAGGSSSFDTIVSLGGSGGSASRNFFVTSNGFSNGGAGGQTNGNFFGGSGGGFIQNLQNNYGAYQSGGVGARQVALNFDGNGTVFYGTGGAGGVPNTVNVETAPANVGQGGRGTGATLNSFANGNAGGSGIVILKWYT